MGGFIKLLYPDGEFSKEQLEEILKFALEMRRRVKEQLKKLGGMEFYDVNFSKVSILNNGENKFFITNDTSLKMGDRVLIPLDNDSEGEGIVVTVRRDFNEEDENIPHIIRKCN